VNLYSYFAHEIHRDWLEQLERDAQLRRLVHEREVRQTPRLHLPVRRRRPQARAGIGAC
jgi:hypothetical protein